MFLRLLYPLLLQHHKPYHLLDRGLILDTDSALWQIKDKAYSIGDGIELARNIMVTIIGIIGFLLLFYFGYKLVITFKEAMKNEK